MMISENGNIIAANSLMQSLLHYTSDELLAKKAEDLAPEKLRAEYAGWRDRFFQEIDDQEPARVNHLHDMRALTKDGVELAQGADRLPLTREVAPRLRLRARGGGRECGRRREHPDTRRGPPLAGRAFYTSNEVGAATPDTPPRGRSSRRSLLP